MRAAFSLIELLVVIAIVALLLGLAIPSLARARATARQTKSLAQVQQAGVTFNLYANTYADSLPYHEPGSWMHAAPPDEVPQATMQDGSPFGIRYSWAVNMHQVAPWRQHYISWLSPGVLRSENTPWSDPQGRSIWPSYFMSNALAADPSTWSPAGGSPGTRAVRISDVTFPSAKAMLIEIARPYLPPDTRDNPTHRIIGGVDGAARLRKDSAARAPARNRLTGSMDRYFDTADGYRGNDW